MTRMCLNWKVLGGLAATGLGISLFALQLLSASLPLLVAAACPLSMLAMMWAMRGMQGGGCSMQGDQARQDPDVGLSSSERLARLRSELEGARARESALASQIAAMEQTEPAADLPRVDPAQAGSRLS